MVPRQVIQETRSWWSTARSSLVVHRSLKWVWIALIPLSIYWRENVFWVVIMSHYAILVGHWSAEEATKPEVRIEEECKDETPPDH